MVQAVYGSPDGTTTITLNPIADQVIDATGTFKPGTTGLHCRADSIKLYRSYLKFDLSGITDPNKIIGVELKLYCDASTVPPATLDVDVHETGDLLKDGTAPWEEANLNWSNAPDIGELIATTAVGDKGSWYDWDDFAMLDYVKAECIGDKNISFAMKLKVEDTSIVFPIPYHRDFSDRLGPNAPQLIITLVLPMTISGHEFDDLDGDGTWDQGEPALEGWTVNLDGPVSKTATSDSAGYYEFTDLVPGTYTISEVLQGGWIQTDPAPPGTYSVSLTSSSVIDRDFGNFRIVTIRADKFDDLNGNGVKDASEPSIVGWTLTISCPNGTTSKLGSPASWLVEQGGIYTVTEEPRDGWIHSTSDNVDVSVKSGDAPPTVWFGNFERATVIVYKYEDADGDLATTDDWTPIDWPVTLTNSSGDYVSSTGTSGKVFGDLGPGSITVTEADDPEWVHLNSSNAWAKQVKSGEIYVVKFVNFHMGMVSGHKFDDADGDGLWDNDEPAMKDWTMHLVGKDMITNTPVDLSALTDDQGYYEFRGLTAGEYTVSEWPQAGWIQTTPNEGTYTIEIRSGSIVDNKDFGNLKLVTITADKWNDLDGDGVRDDGEPEIAGWRLTISCPNGTTSAMDSPASWVVNQNGDYTVSEELQAGWTHSTLSSSVVTIQSRSSPPTIWFGNFKLVYITAAKFDDLNGDGTKDYDEPEIVGWRLIISCPNGTTNEMGSPALWVVRQGGKYTIVEEDKDDYVHTTSQSVDVIVQSGDTPEKIWFGNFKLVTITADKFDDLNGNGERDDGEPEIAGWRLTISCPNGTTSAMDSPASWTVLKGGEYTITEEMQDGWVQTTVSSVGVDVQSGDTPDKVWFGNFQLVTIEAEKYNDLNGNGELDADEPLIYGWDLTLTYPDGTTDTMDSPASWIVGQGGTYTISEEFQDGWIHTTSERVDISVQSGDAPSAIWFGNFELGEISGYKLNDLNGNGIRNEGEPTLEGWTIHLDGYDTITEEEVHRTAVTDNNGYYEFKGLTAGTYTVSEDLKPGWSQTKPGPFGTYTIEITSGTASGSNDFYNFELVTITADKFNDLEGNGVRDDGEPEISGWKLTLHYPNGTTNTMDSPASWAVKQMGTYTITEELQDGWVQTTASSVDVDVQPGGTPSTVWFGNFERATVIVYKYEDADGYLATTDDWTPIDWPVTLTNSSGDYVSSTGTSGKVFGDLGPGSITVTEADDPEWAHLNSSSWSGDMQSGRTYVVNFVNFKLVKITGDKFDDINGNGQKDGGEPEISGWKLTLHYPDGVTTDTKGSPAEWTVDKSGKYTITEELQDGWVQTTASSVDVTVQSGDTPNMVWFGNFERATVIVYKYEDADGYLATTDDWTPIDWPVTLTNSSGDYVSSTGTSGKVFGDLGPGSITVTEADDPEWAHLNSSSWSRTLMSGNTYVVKFVNFKVVTIRADKFEDINGNGQRDDGEPEIVGWALTMTHPDGTTDTMDSPVSWTVGQGGTYTISEELQDGWIHTTSERVDVSVRSGSAQDTVWFGNFKIVKIRADKWDDLDGDGVRDDGEPEIRGWKLTLHYPDGVTTDTKGSPAEWDIYKSGTYTVTEEMQNGWIHTTTSSADITVQSGSNPDAIWFGNFERATVIVYKYEDADGDLATTDDWTPIDWTITLMNGTYLVGQKFTLGADGSITLDSQMPGSVIVTEADNAAWVRLNSSNVWTMQMESGKTYAVKFVNFRIVTIRADKFDDLNGNGVKDASEPSIVGWALTISCPNGTTSKLGSPASWLVEQGGKYTITEEPRDGWIHTTARSVDVNIESGDTPSTVFFGNFKLVTIKADKWNDLDGDGVREQGEPEIRGWKLSIRCPNGTTSTMDSPASWKVKQGGKYTITEEMRCGWVHTTASSVDLVVQSGSAPSTIWFGNWHACSWLSDTSDQRIEVTDFNIVFTPSKGKYKISSTNPGGFYFNILYQTGTDPTTVSYTLANNGNGDFVTKGSMPVHAYIWNDIDKDERIDYWGELTDVTNKITTAQEPNLAKGTIKIKGVPSGTNVLITIHITFGLKGTSGYDLNGAKAFEGKLYTFTADDGFSIQATLTAHAKI